MTLNCSLAVLAGLETGALRLISLASYPPELCLLPPVEPAHKARRSFRLGQGSANLGL